MNIKTTEPQSENSDSKKDNKTYPRTEISYDETSSNLSQILSQTTKQTFKLLRWFIIVVSLFGVTNLILTLISTYIYSDLTPDYLRVLYPTANFLLGLVITLFALSLTYKYFLTKIFGTIYKYLTPLFKKICTKVIDLVLSGGNKLTGKDIAKSINVGSLMIEIYGRKLPRYVQKAVIFIINQIPFSTFLFSMQNELNQQKDSRTLSYILYQQLDSYIKNNIFRGVSMKWIYWLFPLNLILQLVIIFLLK